MEMTSWSRLLGLTSFGRTVAPQVKDLVTKITLPKMREAMDDDYLFHTFWLVVDKLSKTIVAELGFKGPPVDGGRVEIGYGTMPRHAKQRLYDRSRERNFTMGRRP